MAMLTLNGILHNCYEQAESKDRETGEVRPAHIKAQILCENTTPTGEKRFEMVTLKVHHDSYRKLVGQHVRVPVGGRCVVCLIKSAYRFVAYTYQNRSPPRTLAGVAGLFHYAAAWAAVCSFFRA